MTNIVSWQSGGFLSAVELTMLLILQTHTARTCPQRGERSQHAVWLAPFHPIRAQPVARRSMARLGCLLTVLTLQLAQSLFQPAMARSCSQVSARPLAVRSRMIFNLAGEEVNGYRELGLPEDATYDKVMDAFMELSEQYRDDPERILVSARPFTRT